LIGVFARLSWSDLRGDRCAIFFSDKNINYFVVVVREVALFRTTRKLSFSLFPFFVHGSVSLLLLTERTPHPQQEEEDTK
jgi:hypothetical protein